MDIGELIALTLHEDIGDGDITTLATVDRNHESQAKIIAKQEGILCGEELVNKVFHQVDPEISIQFLKKDGDFLSRTDTVAVIQGKTRSILMAERTSLNFLGHLSGISTRAHQVVHLLNNSHIKILDTRKSIPLLRKWQKYAVKIGGGENHRFGLYDMFLIKENHINAAGGIRQAVERALQFRSQRQGNWKIEVETRTIEEVKEVTTLPVDIIMLDNMPLETLEKCISIIRRTPIKIEVSGNITEETLSIYRNLDIDYISMGALTHSVKNFDFSLLIQD